MGFEWESYFECVECGTTDKSSVIEYDWLGYPVCPSCGERRGPLWHARTADARHTA